MTAKPVAWDFFLAHAGADTSAALRLYDALSREARVFLDDRSLKPGDRWHLALPQALRHTRVVVVLISAHTRQALYEDSEIRIAIDLLRAHPQQHMIIPLLLDEETEIRREDLPYGLETFVPVSLARCGGMKEAAVQLLNAAREAEPAADRRSDLVDSTAAIAGYARQGPTWPVLLTRWEDYLSLFGDPLDPGRSFLGLAVRGFFENGDKGSMSPESYLKVRHWLK